VASYTEELVGRDEELSAIDELLEHPPGTLVLEGEPGIGKTTLWRRGVDLAAERSYRVLVATPVAAEAQLAYAPFRDLFDGLFAELGAELPGLQRHALSVALLRADREGPSPGQDAVAAGCLSLLRAAARTAPVLVAVDDVQWLDPSSALVLGFAARRMREDPVSFLFCLRSEHHAPLLDLERLADAESSRRVVAPLTTGALRQLLIDRLQMPLPRPTLRAVYELSRGNPFFALEIARALPGDASLWSPGTPLPVPPTLRGLVATRISNLPTETRMVLAAAAAASEPTIELVAAATGSERLEEALSPALEEHVVHLEGERVRFAHPLFAAAAYESVAPERRRELHSALSSLVEDLEERARNLALAADGRDETTAATLDEAARTAFKRGAPQAAADLCEQARTLTPPELTDALRRRTLTLVEYLLHAGESGRARELLERLLVESADSPTRAEVLSFLGWAEFFGLHWQRSHDSYAAALAEPGASDAVRARSAIGVANALGLLLRRDLAAAAEHTRTAVLLAEGLQDRALLAEALATQAVDEFLLGRHSLSRELLERALAIDADFSATPVVLAPQASVALLAWWSGDLEASRLTWEDLLAQAVERGDETSHAWLLARIAVVDCVQGSFSDAKKRLHEAHETVTLTGQEANRSVVLAVRALVEAHLGNVAAARSAGGEALTIALELHAKFAERIARSALGFLALSLQRPDEAHTHLEGLLEEDRAASIREPSEFRFLPDNIEALIALGRLQDAETELEFLEDCANAAGRTSAIAAACRCRALLAAAQGDLSRALAAAREAVALAAQVESPFERGRSLFVLGVVLRRAKQLRAARESFEAASAVFERIGTRLWVERTRAELAHIGGRRASSHELTSTERRVAALVAEGLSNREVSSRLFVTQKTVEFHLRNIFRKLRVRSRTELARLLASKP
jgi:DNA-binding CsgD family transcriptional regulator